MRLRWLVSTQLAIGSIVANSLPEIPNEARSIFPTPSPRPRRFALSQGICPKCLRPCPESREEFTFNQVFDALTLPDGFVVDAAETFGQGFGDLVAGKTFRAVLEISIIGVYAIIK
ncbi:hypothetical protein BDV38DRAFT_279855 [Aspergillus pseudotamarii]|uniref:Uncharacterized protein n=1 Tax=Aspergillus pseudotamarii TaxID=132259 RepID=A0A5N6T3N4_ASPPS|nr:uncharacterized protein BDV38DRAFT_279855 [Aspergillus pseudotamarii]KAE8140879.1 hypothetical protein BDV38DRAFT_279855 [Aspergillus pseudotamarii]